MVSSWKSHRRHPARPRCRAQQVAVCLVFIIESVLPTYTAMPRAKKLLLCPSSLSLIERLKVHRHETLENSELFGLLIGYPVPTA